MTTYVWAISQYAELSLIELVTIRLLRRLICQLCNAQLSERDLLDQSRLEHRHVR